MRGVGIPIEHAPRFRVGHERISAAFPDGPQHGRDQSVSRRPFDLDPLSLEYIGRVVLLLGTAGDELVCINVPPGLVAGVAAHGVVGRVVAAALAPRDHMLDRGAVGLALLGYCIASAPAAAPILRLGKPVTDVDLLGREIRQLGLEPVIRVNLLPIGFLGMLVEHAGDVEFHAFLSVASTLAYMGLPSTKMLPLKSLEKLALNDGIIEKYRLITNPYHAISIMQTTHTDRLENNMEDIINQSRCMSDAALEKWIYDNLDQNEDLAGEFHEMIANLEIQKEDGENDENFCLAEFEESYGWGLRYFFLMLNGMDEDRARDLAEYR